MTQAERRLFLLETLLCEKPREDLTIPPDEYGQKRLLRSLFNVRMPLPADKEFLAVQDAYLKEETAQKGLTAIDDLTPLQPDLYLWQGDITTLVCDAVVNAANAEMLGCFCPCHGCIDNAIHTYAGVELRLKCAEIMKEQGHKEPTGGAKITPAYNLPCKYILHTVGPIAGKELTERDCALLASCYRACLSLAEQNDVTSIAFPCISTGVFRFPGDKAAEIAIRTVKEYRSQTNSHMKVIFNVFKDRDYDIYRGLLGADQKTER